MTTTTATILTTLLSAATFAAGFIAGRSGRARPRKKPRMVTMVGPGCPIAGGFPDTAAKATSTPDEEEAK